MTARRVVNFNHQSSSQPCVGAAVSFFGSPVIIPIGIFTALAFDEQCAGKACARCADRLPHESALVPFYGCDRELDEEEREQREDC